MSRKFQILILIAGLMLPIASGCAQGPFARANPASPPPAQAGPWNAPPATEIPSVQVPEVGPGAIPSQPATPGGYPTVPPLPPAGSVIAPPPQAASPASGTFPNNLSNPGTMAEQQRQAEKFDPYSDNNAGPEIVGGRPRDFQKPPADPTRTNGFNGFRDTRWPF